MDNDSPVNGTIITAIDSRMKVELGLDSLDADSIHGLKIISRGTAILLLFVYLAYLYFQVCTPVALFGMRWDGLADHDCAHTSSLSHMRTCTSQSRTMTRKRNTKR